VRRTLARAVVREGVGLHGGAPVCVRLGPAAAGEGIVFARVDLSGTPALRASVDAVADVRRCVALAPAGGAPGGARTVEHLLATLYAVGVCDARVELDAPELPALDGSAQGWLDAVDEAGVAEVAGDAPAPLVVRARLGVEGAALEPLAGAGDVPRLGPRLEIDATHDPGRGLPVQRLVLTLTAQTFRSDIAPARTFAFADEVDALHAAGLARGGTLDNALVLDAAGAPVGPGRLRFPDEPVRHKILDALGDLSLLGRPLHARLTLHRSSHAAHVALARLLAS
jgi:UDP-3-O-[3-hydroxymyristoyl] N-acetylglucosamine deacetylase